MKLCNAPPLAAWVFYYPAVARAIEETGYKGWVGHEFLPKGERMPALQQAFDVFNI